MKNQPHQPFSPDSLLYIYYIQGRFPTNQRFSVADFLGNWEEDGFSFLFFRSPAQEYLVDLINKNPALRLLDTFEMTYEQWQGGKIEPVEIGQFQIVPPWLKQPVADKNKTIILDPGVVFGNGNHPTTRDCLEAIGIVCAGKKVHTMLDLGTGTGILSLAAVKLGCGKALAVDFNYLAARTARTNALLNDMENTICVIQGRAEEYTMYPSDLLVANIHFEVMNTLIRTPGFLGQKWFLLSGLLKSEALQVLDFLSSQPVIIIKKWDQNGTWTTILGITRND